MILRQHLKRDRAWPQQAYINLRALPLLPGTILTFPPLLQDPVSPLSIMKHLIFTLLALASTSALAQDPGPSPTASVGCEPHGDHWHCDGPATGAASTTSELHRAPSPTESVGCQPHGDHWHCDGPASTAAMTTAPSGDHDHDHDHDHDDDDGAATPTVPSPTESVGCEPHGDHWHCDGPRETGSASAGTSGAAASTLVSTTSSATVSTTGAQQSGGAGSLSVELSVAVGLAVAAAAFHV
ncbi:hypothetical protein IFM46972_03189 [Aspergillus udagawae]|uniref:Uncharacterized protein n=1 Tax=Aspergillus udagawae TaxID=91492 RepID=A0A8H3RSZ7_9EURO|nr:hypothetical protein IFM46972_03189 [Aspergillus udagawae]